MAELCHSNTLRVWALPHLFSIDSQTPSCRFQEAEEFEPVDSENVEAQGPLFDEDGHPVQLDELELVDEYGNEINVYNEAGFRIPRRVPYHYDDEQPCALLADLKQVYKLFNMSVNDGRGANNDPALDDDIDDLHDQVNIKVYPQALLRSYGYFQANAVPAGFHPLIRSVNQQLAYNADSEQPVLVGVACQGYNHVQHCLTGRSGGIEVVHGQITAALAGTRVEDSIAKLKHKRVVAGISKYLPHDHIREKLRKPDITRGFRMEPVWQINCSQLKNEMLRGSCVIR